MEGITFLKSYHILKGLMFAAHFPSISRASGFAPDISKAKQSAQSLFAILDRQPRIENSSPKKNADTPSSLSTSSLRISFRNVWFAYPTRATQMVLKGLDLKIEPGQTVALVGGSGSGKSTVVALIERLVYFGAVWVFVLGWPFVFGPYSILVLFSCFPVFCPLGSTIFCMPRY